MELLRYKSILWPNETSPIYKSFSRYSRAHDKIRFDQKFK
jgi:hypothetical protein